MQMDIASPPSAAAAQGIGTHRHAAPVPPIPARIRRALTVVVVVVGLAAGVVTLCLPDSAANRIDAALGRLRDWPSMTVDGTLTNATGPVTVHATITADGVAHGTVERSGDARAEFAVGQGATLLRGNRQWWSDEPPVLVNQLTNRWITDPREDAVGLIASGRLAPAAVADALGVLRDPDGRNEADTVVNGVGGTAFTRAGARLVISDDGRPLAVDLPRSTAADALPGTAITFRPGPRIDAPASGVSIGVATPGPGEDDAARRAVTDVLAELRATSAASLPSRDDIVRSASEVPPVAIAVAPEPGCRRSGCSLRVGLTNRGPSAITGLFVLEVSGETVKSGTLTLPARTTTTLTIELPANVLAATGGSSFRTKASFELAPGAGGGPGAAAGSSEPGHPIDDTFLSRLTRGEPR
jgi:hypothetical protein